MLAPAQREAAHEQGCACIVVSCDECITCSPDETQDRGPACVPGCIGTHLRGECVVVDDGDSFVSLATLTPAQVRGVTYTLSVARALAL